MHTIYSLRRGSLSARGALCSMALASALLIGIPESDADDEAARPDPAAWGHSEARPGIPEWLSGLEFGMTEDEAATRFPDMQAAGWFASARHPTVELDFRVPHNDNLEATPTLQALQLGLEWGTEQDIAEVEAVWGEPLRLQKDADSAFYLYWFDEEAGIRAVISGSADAPPSMVEVEPYTSLAGLLDDERLGLTRKDGSLVGKRSDEVAAIFGDAFASRGKRTSVSIPGVETTLGKSRVVFRVDDDELVRGWRLAIPTSRDPALPKRIRAALAAEFGKPEPIEEHGTEYLRYGDEPAVVLEETNAGFATLHVGARW